MENFTMMLGYNPEVTHTRLSKRAECNTVYFRKPKKTIQMFSRRSVSLILYHKLS